MRQTKDNAIAELKGKKNQRYGCLDVGPPQKKGPKKALGLRRKHSFRWKILTRRENTHPASRDDAQDQGIGGLAKGMRGKRLLMDLGDASINEKARGGNYENQKVKSFV